MTRPKVSVCIPVYNAEEYLSECLDSLVNQTLKDIEIICVNDGSTDGSLDILNRYADKYKNVKVANQENQGLGAARNAGILNSRGKYVGFVDADDYVDHTMFETLYELAKKEKSEIAMCNLTFEPNNGTKKHLWFKEFRGKVDGEFLDRNIQPWNKIVSRDLIDRTGFKFYQKNGDDMFIMLMIASDGISSTREKLYHYRVGHSTMSNTFKIENFLNFIDCTNAQIEALRKTKYYEGLKEYFEYRMIYVLIQTLAVSALKRDHRTFLMCRKMLEEYNYKSNPFVQSLLKKDFSGVEFLGMVYILPVNYYLSTALMGVKLKGWK